MKRFNLLLIGLVLCAAVAVGYSDSHVIKKESFQVVKGIASHTIAVEISVAELPVFVSVEAPYLGRPASNYILVSEELTNVFKMRIRPPPDKVQKSDYNKITKLV